MDSTNKYSVLIQWCNTSDNYQRFNGGLEIAEPLHDTVKSANRAAADWLFFGDNEYYYFPWEYQCADERTGLQFGIDDTLVVIDFNSTEPTSVDFGEGVIYVSKEVVK